TSNELQSKVQLAVNQGLDEGGSNGISPAFVSANKATFSCASTSPITSTDTFDNTSPYYYETAAASTTQKAGVLHTSQASGRTVLPIDGVAQTYNVTSSNMLYRIISWGYKPTFNAVPGETGEETTARTNAQTIYNNARAVSLTICNDEMSDLEKAHAIYDWIIADVEYDYALAGAGGEPSDEIPNPTADQSLAYDGFYLEGVFLKGTGETRRAVCDGKSKAFTLLCGLEGIKSFRVIGYIENDPAKGHAWNKVLLDTDDDGIKNWYAADTTWGDPIRGGFEYSRHNYFLLSDTEISGTHTENRDYYAAADDSAFEYFEYISYTVNEAMLDGERMVGLVKVPSEISNTATAVVSTVEQLAVLLAVAQLYGYTEFKITVDFNSIFYDAKYMLADETGSWTISDGAYYCLFYTP
ncbi:MAG TPA: transglutaminase domain-containing protein, partial [Clostridia bacterium]|nr:transglutaminase domain-containing protein [Clostridia bacterium]